MKVSPYVRAMLAVFALFAVWMVWWLDHARDFIEPLLPSLMNVSGWVLAWACVVGFAALGAVTGRDLYARLGFAAMAVVSVMGAVTVAMDNAPLIEQFWAGGQAVVLAAACFVMLLSPMRNPPHGRGDGFPV